jgi:hypothetical protein
MVVDEQGRIRLGLHEPQGQQESSKPVTMSGRVLSTNPAG